MSRPKLYRINLIPLILSVPTGKVILTEEMQALKVALQEEIDETFITWQGPAIEPLPKVTQKICRVWRRVCRDEVYVS